MVLAGAGLNGAQAAEDQRARESQVAEYEDQIAASHAQVTSAAEQVVAAHATALGELNATVTRGESLLTAGEHEGTDHAVREALTTLRAALDEATSLAQHSEPGTITEELVVPAIEHHSRWTDNSRDAQTNEVAVSTDFSPTRLAEAAAAVESAATAVRSTQLEWARPLLADAIAAGEAALETSEGHVHDDDARRSLRASLTRARAIHDGAGYSADDALAACDSVETATTAVGDAQTAWQAEQGRIAAEKAAADKASADKTNQASASSGSSSSSGSSVQDPVKPGASCKKADHGNTGLNAKGVLMRCTGPGGETPRWRAD